MTELPECLCVKNGVKTFPSMLILLFSKIPQFRIRRAINFLLTDWNDLNHHMDIHFTVDYPFLFSFAFVVGLYIASHSSHLFKVFNHPYQNCFFSQSIWFIVAFIISSSPIVSLHYELFRLTLLWNRILHCIPLLFPIFPIMDFVLTSQLRALNVPKLLEWTHDRLKGPSSRSP